ncbi:MAG: hypothetical protein ACI9U2_003787 [Bradymonadia bacterium]|jgi:hypothetical protein
MLHRERRGRMVTPLMRIWLSMLLMAFGLGACDDGDGGLRDTLFPDLQVDPDQIVLNVVPVGDSTDRVITLRNVGGARLLIETVTFSNATDGREFSKEHPETPFILEASGEQEIRLVYSPRDLGADQGALIITSTDSDTPRVVVPIVTAMSDTELRIDPDRLVYEVAGEGIVDTKSVTISNLGNVPVVVLDVRLGDGTSEDFTLTDDAAERPILAQGDQVSYSVSYTARGGDFDVGSLIIATDDAVYGEILIPLEAVQPSPEIDVTPPSVIFGAVDLNTETPIEQVFIENLGNADLTIESIALALAPAPNNEQFTLHGLEGVEWPLVVPAESLFEFGINYHPTVDGVHETAIVITNNDADEGVTTVPVRGRVRAPCIAVNPMAMNFGRVALNQDSARNQMQIVNCGDLPVLIEDINIMGEGYRFAPVDADPIGQALDPRATVTIEVWYENSGLAEGVLADGILTVINDTPNTPEIPVPLQVVGGGAPTCDLLVIPERVNYGLVARGRAVSRDLQVVNRGTGACEITSEVLAPFIPIPGFPIPFILTGRVGNVQVPPGAFLPLEITYRPALFSNDSAIYTVNYNDPFDAAMPQKMATATLSGIGGESDIAVIPGRVDFGAVTAGECASREERVTVYNNGIVDLCIRDIRFEGDGCGEFFLVDRPVADEDGCIRVTRRTPADFTFVYEPGDLGADACDLVLVSDANNAPEFRVPLSGEGVADRRQTDVFEQTSGRTVDVLFVVDNSGSMGEEQRSLQRNFGSFINGAQQFQNDYQLGVVTTDMDAEAEKGRLQGNPRIMRRGPGVEAQFSDTVDVGTNGAGTELGLEAARRALSDPLIFDTEAPCAGDGDCVEPDQCVLGFCGGHNRGFLREDAALEIIFVSDEDDFSQGTLNFYVDFFKNIKGFRNEARFSASAIVGANNGRAQACMGNGGDASPGHRYVEVADRTNGRVLSICDDNFGPNLRDLGNQAFGLQSEFFLSRPAVRQSVEVRVDGQLQNAGWFYDEESNSVVFEEGSVPQPMQTIQVDYEARCFPRRN